MARISQRTSSLCPSQEEEHDQFHKKIIFRKIPNKRRVVSVTVAPPRRHLQPPKKSSSTGDLQTITNASSIQENSKNDNMVMQLVMPSPSSIEHNNNYLTARSFEEIIDNNLVKDRHQDQYSSISNAGGGGLPPPSPPPSSYINHGYAMDHGEFGRPYPMESVPQTPALSSSSGGLCTATVQRSLQQPTSLKEKKRVFRKLLSKILSGVYALFIVTIGIAVYIIDVVDGNNPIAETFSLYLVVVSLLYILYLTIDISFYMKKRNEIYDFSHYNSSLEIELKGTMDGQYHGEIELPKFPKPLQHHYCLDKNGHTANFYLKIGAVGFCLGHLIHSGLLLGYQIVFLTSNNENYYNCASVATLVLDFVYPFYSFILLYFIFKYANIIINRHIALARFGLMHCMSSSLCFWTWTIFRETVESVSNHANSSNHKTVSEVAFLTDHQPVALPLTSYNKRGAQLLTSYVNVTVRRFAEICGGDEGLKKIYQNFSPYLYPFSVEYSILVVGILFIIWQNIGSCKDTEDDMQCNNLDSPASLSGNYENHESNIVIHVDCHSANKGLFGGIVIMVLTVVSIILFFIAIDEEGDVRIGVLVNEVTTLTIITLMVLTAFFSYRQITKLDVSHGPHHLLDDLLLFICLPAFFLNGIFSIIPAIIHGNILGIIIVILETIQILVQTPLIIDGLRRVSNTRELRREKPGRELITFLIACNVALWITQTFEVKSHGLQDNRYEFYGYELWTIIGHMCVPLMMFYRFHSSVCIVDVWKFAYEPQVRYHKGEFSR